MAPTSLCGTQCVNLATDPMNCGACGDACGGGRDCVASNCQCPMGLTLCGTQCTNTLTDSANCNRCGNDCNGGSCNTGICACPSGKSLCNGTCIDYTADLNNCGGCGKVCAPGQTCGTTGCACPTGQKACGVMGCIDITHDNLNCGDCGKTCGTMQFCNSGTCQAMFTCETTFNAPASAWCPYMPLNQANCGGKTMLGQPVTASGTAAQATWATVPFPADPSLYVTVTGTVLAPSGSVNFDTAFRNAMGTYVNSVNQTVGTVLSQPNVNLSWSNTAWACWEAVDVGVWTNSTQGLNYNLTVTRWDQARFNAGGTSLQEATPLDAGMSGACDHVCGYLHNDGCNNYAGYYSFTIPAGKAVDVMIHVATTFTGSCFGGCPSGFFQLLSGGSVACSLASASVTVGNPQDFIGRAVNNTAVDQQVDLLIDVTHAGIGYDIALALEQ
jgi:hypothetical protein